MSKEGFFLKVLTKVRLDTILLFIMQDVYEENHVR